MTVTLEYKIISRCGVTANESNIYMIGHCTVFSNDQNPCITSSLLHIN